MARIVIGAYLFRFPLGGYMSWVLQWLVGFERLGHDVYVMERGDYPDSCYNPSNGQQSDDCSYGLATVGAFLSAFGFGDRWCFHDRTGNYHGLSQSAVTDIFASADLFVDMGAHGAWQHEAARAARTVLVDGEPGRTQIRRRQRKDLGLDVPEYDFYFTVGLNVGTGRSIVPTDGIQWRPVFDPINSDLFPVVPGQPDAPFTTIMSWRAHSELEHDGVTYGQKNRSFESFVDLPGRVRAPLEMAVSGGREATTALAGAGWRVRNALNVTVSFDTWREYITSSRGEFSVCKDIFVSMNTGWFSDRSAVYLACGRPVVLQDTGFSAHLPCGRGLFAFRTVEEAAAAIDAIQSDYEQHSRGAREIAAEYLAAEKVLPRFLREMGL